MMEQKKLARNNIILLTCLLLFILFFPVFSVHRVLIKNIIFSAIIFFGVLSLDFEAKTRQILSVSGIITVVLIWTDHFFPNHIFGLLFFISFFCFNLFIAIVMIRHVAKSKNVTLPIIINSINGYLIIGVLGSVLLATSDLLQKYVYHSHTGAINFAGSTAEGFHDYLYFSFVTITTLGYGDITPVSSIAKSVTLLIALSGQLYLTILVAILVGKFLRRKDESE